MSVIGSIYTNSFPSGIRTNAYEAGTIAYVTDAARIAGLEAIHEWIKTLGDQFQILTSSEVIPDLEAYLGIPTDNTLTLSERRMRIVIKMAGQPATIGNIKRIAKEIVGVDITIHEHGHPASIYYDPVNHPWKVTIVVDRNLPGAKSFKKTYFESIMKDIFPAHTEWELDSFVYIPKVSYLAPTTGGKEPFILDQSWLQF